VGLALLAATLLGCRGDVDAGDPDVRVRLGISPTPPLVGATRVLVEVRDGDTPATDATVTLEGSMNHAGMVPVLDSAEALDPGQYVVPDFDFNMSGDWVVEVRVQLPDGRMVTRRFPVRVTGGGA
jgi:hypothetical protein